MTSKAFVDCKTVAKRVLLLLYHANPLNPEDALYLEF